MTPAARPTGFKRVAAALRWLEDALLVALLGSLVLLASLQIVLRNVFDSGIIWGDPLLRVLVLWVGLLGAMVASRDDRHITVDVLSEALPPRGLALARTLTNLFTASVAGVIAAHASRFVAMEYEAGASAFAQLPAWPFEAILPLAFGVISLRSILGFSAQLRALFSARPAA